MHTISNSDQAALGSAPTDNRTLSSSDDREGDEFGYHFELTGPVGTTPAELAQSERRTRALTGNTQLESPPDQAGDEVALLTDSGGRDIEKDPRPIPVINDPVRDGASAKPPKIVNIQSNEMASLRGGQGQASLQNDIVMATRKSGAKIAKNQGTMLSQPHIAGLLGAAQGGQSGDTKNHTNRANLPDVTMPGQTALALTGARAKALTAGGTQVDPVIRQPAPVKSTPHSMINSGQTPGYSGGAVPSGNAAYAYVGPVDVHASTSPAMTPTTGLFSPPLMPAGGRGGRQNGMVNSMVVATGLDQISPLSEAESTEPFVSVLPELPVRTGTIHSVAGITMRPEIPRLVASQMADALVTAQNNRIEITLNPEELGRVRMVLSPADTGVSILIAAERPETLDMMRRHLGQLSDEFRNLGYEDISFEFSGGDAQGTFNGEADGSHPDGPFEAENPHDMPEPIPVQIARTAQSRGLDLRL